jgi:hypothetical protein
MQRHVVVSYGDLRGLSHLPTKHRTAAEFGATESSAPLHGSHPHPWLQAIVDLRVFMSGLDAMLCVFLSCTLVLQLSVNHSSISCCARPVL